MKNQHSQFSSDSCSILFFRSESVETYTNHIENTLSHHHHHHHHIICRTQNGIHFGSFYASLPSWVIDSNASLHPNGRNQRRKKNPINDLRLLLGGKKKIPSKDFITVP